MRKESENNLSRRNFIINSTGGGFAALLLACGIKKEISANAISGSLSSGANLESICTLTKAREEGPFYIEGSTVRKNIRDGSAGKNVLLRIQLVDVANNCRPVQNAVVSIWHCNANGVYSGYENMNPGNSADGLNGPPNGMPPNGMRPPRDGNGGPPKDANGRMPPPPRDGRMGPPPRDNNGMMMPPPQRDGNGGPPRDGRGGGEPMHENPTSDKRYLRGVQITNELGFAEFETVYPGWYAPRAVHIHTKIFLNDREMLTTQMFFPEKLNERIFSTVDPYKARGITPFKTANDGIAGQNPPILDIKEEGDLIIGTITIGMQSA